MPRGRYTQYSADASTKKLNNFIYLHDHIRKYVTIFSFSDWVDAEPKGARAGSRSFDLFCTNAGRTLGFMVWRRYFRIEDRRKLKDRPSFFANTIGHLGV